jgi:8-oxo-dGTP pyrophosphatase MutT (NUDIX family)
LPITSYGIIAMRQTPETEYLLICRRDSLSFIEFVRGKYSSSDYLHMLLVNMTQAEHDKIASLSFEQLWRSVWGAAADTHKTDYENSLRKYKTLEIGSLLKDHPAKWLEPEWGFPKGRRNVNESDLAGAIREFKEETNLRDSQFQILQNVVPLVESFRGSNQIQYCHKYYLAYAEKGIGEEPLDIAAQHNAHIKREVGCVKWLGLEEAVKCIRPENEEKRQVLFRVHKILQRFCPLALFTPGTKKSA